MTVKMSSMYIIIVGQYLGQREQELRHLHSASTGKDLYRTDTPTHVLV